MVIYKTTNLINGKYYIGKDAKNSKNYLGSGTHLKNAIRKYGKCNFKKEILCYCSDLVDLNKKEIEYITQEIINDVMSYNLALGGQGGDLSKFIKKHPAKGIGFKQMFIDKLGEEAGIKKYKEYKDKKSKSSAGDKNGMFKKGEKISGDKNGMSGRKGELCPAFNNGHEAWNKGKRGMQTHSNETKQNMSNIHKNLDHNYYIQQVDKNGKELGVFKTISEAVNVLHISRKKAYNNTFLEFTFKKIYK